MEYRQVVRQWTLNPSYKGSIPFTPAKTSQTQSFLQSTKLIAMKRIAIPLHCIIGSFSKKILKCLF